MKHLENTLKHLENTLKTHWNTLKTPWVLRHLSHSCTCSLLWFHVRPPGRGRDVSVISWPREDGVNFTVLEITTSPFIRHSFRWNKNKVSPLLRLRRLPVAAGSCSSLCCIKRCVQEQPAAFRCSGNYRISEQQYASFFHSLWRTKHKRETKCMLLVFFACFIGKQFKENTLKNQQ